MIKIRDTQRRLLAILENAFNIGYEKRLNELWLANFSLPLDDPKNEHCEEFNLVELIDDSTGEYVGLYRIVPSQTSKNESSNIITYELQHVLSTLMDDVLFQYHQLTNRTTTQSIQYLLDRQEVAHWKLGRVDFSAYHTFKAENENGLLGTLFEIPKTLTEDYQFTYDTKSYPWTLNLVKASTKVTCEIRYGKNLQNIEREIDPYNVVNRIYPLGAGEGVNQLTIKDVNGGVPYLEDAASIAKYGRKKFIWADRRFEDAQSLKENAAALLAKWKQPKVVYKVKAADLSSLTGSPVDKFVEGALVRIVDPDLGTILQRIHYVGKSDIKAAPGDIKLEIGNLSDDLGTNNAEIERRQQVNDAYTQGATNILTYDYNDNADSTHPATLDIWVPNDLVNVNELNLTYKLEKFRAYSQATEGGGATSVTSSSGGGTVKSTSAGGGQTTSSGGATTQTSTSGGGSTVSSTFTSPTFFLYSSPPVGSGTGSTPLYENHTHAVEVTDDRLSHRHSVTVPSHQHSVSIPSHTHTVSDHTHSVTIENHSHSITLPDHTHELKFGIYELATVPNSVTIKVDGNTVPVTAKQAQEINLIPYLAKDSSGKVTRGTWHKVEIKPSGLARVTASAVSRLFVSSHIGGTY
jgi:phage minor structural protein